MLMGMIQLERGEDGREGKKELLEPHVGKLEEQELVLKQESRPEVGRGLIPGEKTGYGCR